MSFEDSHSMINQYLSAVYGESSTIPVRADLGGHLKYS